jgi:hypothetical protein
MFEVKRDYPFCVGYQGLHHRDKRAETRRHFYRLGRQICCQWRSTQFRSADKDRCPGWITGQFNTSAFELATDLNWLTGVDVDRLRIFRPARLNQFNAVSS